VKFTIRLALIAFLGLILFCTAQEKLRCTGVVKSFSQKTLYIDSYSSSQVGLQKRMFQFRRGAESYSPPNWQPDSFDEIEVVYSRDSKGNPVAHEVQLLKSGAANRAEFERLDAEARKSDAARAQQVAAQKAAPFGLRLRPEMADVTVRVPRAGATSRRFAFSISKDTAQRFDLNWTPQVKGLRVTPERGVLDRGPVRVEVEAGSEVAPGFYSLTVEVKDENSKSVKVPVSVTVQ
jgi:hypothetical protein